MISGIYFECCKVYSDLIRKTEKNGQDPEQLQKQFVFFYDRFQGEIMHRINEGRLTLSDMELCSDLITIKSRRDL